MPDNRWTHINLFAFMREMACNDEKDGNTGGAATLTIESRNVQGGRWYTLGWTGLDNERHIVEASRLDLLAERAIEIELRAEAAVDALAKVEENKEP